MNFMSLNTKTYNLFLNSTLNFALSLFTLIFQLFILITLYALGFTFYVSYFPSAFNFLSVSPGLNIL